ncbi:MAG: hypothetical protein AAGD05_11530 [Bacteroidota bacterium]
MNPLKYFLGLALLSFVACTQPPDYPDEPIIEYKTMTKNTMLQGSVNNDSLLMTVTFTDGDGDLGEMGDNRDPQSSVYLVDTRINDTLTPRTIPFVPEQGAGNGISGDMSFTVFTTCCIYLGQACQVFEDQPIDTVRYLIQIKDRAGNFSNVVESEPIFLLCQ